MRLSQVGEVLVSVDFVAAGSDSRQGQFGREVEKDHDVWQPCSMQSKQFVEFVDELSFAK